MRLNGWRRLSIVLCAAWLAICAAIAMYQWREHQEGPFTSVSLPVGVTVGEGKVAFPDGKVFELQPANAKSQPWEIDWQLEREVPLVIRWLRLLAIGVALPLLIWVFGEALARIGFWVKAGFRAPPAP